MKIVIAIDSFKGCLTSVEAGQAAREGVLKAYPDADVQVLPIADGGEGTGSTLHHYLGGETHHVTISDPLGREVEAQYILIGDKAIVEMAQASGLTLLNEHERNVLNTSTFGFGQLIRAAIRNGAKEIICTLGGSATNDAGLGALQALGLRIFGTNGEFTTPITGKNLQHITHFELSSLKEVTKGVSFTYLYDADIDFYGPHGAACMYAAQKGADETTIAMLDKAMQRLTTLPPFSAAFTDRHIPGTGAAGGTGGGLTAFLDAKSIRGIDAVLDASDFDRRIEGTNLVVTGEGCADSQTRQGKAAAGILGRCRQSAVPVILIAGKIKDASSLIADGYSTLIDINNPVLLNTAGLCTDEDPLNPEVAHRRIVNALTLTLKKQIPPTS